MGVNQVLAARQVLSTAIGCGAWPDTARVRRLYTLNLLVTMPHVCVLVCAPQAQLAEAEGQLQQAATDKLQVQLELSQAQVGVQGSDRCCRPDLWGASCRSSATCCLMPNTQNE